METKSIKQTVTFSASPKRIYDLIMDAKLHSQITGSEVKTSAKPKGEFEAYDGYVHGYNLEIIPGEKIKQAWHFAEDGWPQDHFSICTFKFEPLEKGTKMTFTQTGVPSHKVNALKSGWKEYYWNPMKKILKK